MSSEQVSLTKCIDLTAKEEQEEQTNSLKSEKIEQIDSHAHAKNTNPTDKNETDKDQKDNKEPRYEIEPETPMEESNINESETHTDDLRSSRILPLTKTINGKVTKNHAEKSSLRPNLKAIVQMVFKNIQIDVDEDTNTISILSSNFRYDTC